MGSTDGSKGSSKTGLVVGIGCVLLGFVGLIVAIPVGLGGLGAAFYFTGVETMPPENAMSVESVLAPVDSIEAVAVDPVEPDEVPDNEVVEETISDEEHPEASPKPKRKVSPKPAPEPEPEVVEEEPEPEPDPVIDEEDPDEIDKMMEDFDIEDLDAEDDKKKKKKRGR